MSSGLHHLERRSANLPTHQRRSMAMEPSLHSSLSRAQVARQLLEIEKVDCVRSTLKLDLSRPKWTSSSQIGPKWGILVSLMIEPGLDEGDLYQFLS